MLAAIASVAPGRPLREGLDRIRQAHLGALIVVSDEPSVLSICSGGFLLDAGFTPQRLSELAKMDGAIILAVDASRIARANVHLVPDPTVATAETGTRHRTAERVARSLNVPVLSISESRDAITVYLGDEQHPLLPPGLLLARANQALQTLEHYRTRLDATARALSALEVEDLVTVRDVASLLQRAEMVRRIADEIEVAIVELGTDGRLVRLQLEELAGDRLAEIRLADRDYLSGTGDTGPILDALADLDVAELLDLKAVATRLSLGDADADLAEPLQSRGFRLLGRVRGLAPKAVTAIVGEFGSLQRILRATPDELSIVPQIDRQRAHIVKDSLSRLTESAILDRHI